MPHVGASHGRRTREEEREREGERGTEGLGARGKEGMEGNNESVRGKGRGGRKGESRQEM